MTCPHDLAERETSCADGMCPLCSAAGIKLLQEALTISTALMERVDARAALEKQWGDAITANRAALKDTTP